MTAEARPTTFYVVFLLFPTPFSLSLSFLSLLFLFTIVNCNHVPLLLFLVLARGAAEPDLRESTV